MPESFSLTPFSLNLLILVIVLVINGVISTLSNQQPLQFFQLYCMQLAKKVNRTNNGNDQQTLAGLLALLITLVPIVIILWLFSDFVAVPPLWRGLLLYLAVGSLTLGKVTKKVKQALITNQVEQAKQLLTPLLLRNVQPLSISGLSKATIEMQLLRVTQQVYVVCFIYLCVGALPALCYRLLLEMHYCWNTKLPRFYYFGLCCQRCVKLLQWLPSRLIALLMLLVTPNGNKVVSWRLTRKYFFNLNENFVLATHALALGIKLGGVAMYEQHKVQKPSFNDQAKQPEPKEISLAMSMVNFCLYSSLALLVVVAFCAELFSLPL